MTQTKGAWSEHGAGFYDASSKHSPPINEVGVYSKCEGENDINAHALQCEKSCKLRKVRWRGPRATLGKATIPCCGGRTDYRANSVPLLLVASVFRTLFHDIYHFGS